MRKRFAGFAVALAAVMCVSFAACGEDKVDAESVEGKEVTEAQWDAAFEALVSEDAVYTVQSPYTVRGEVIHKTTATQKEQTASYTLKFSGFAAENSNLEHSRIEQQIVDYSGDVKEVFHLSDDVIEGNAEGVNALEYYVEMHDATNFDVYENGWNTDSWKYYPNTRNATFVRSVIFIFVSICKGNFASFRYDSEKNGYVASEEFASDKDVDGYLPYAVLKFDADGKFVALCGEREYKGYNPSISGNDDRQTNIKFQFTIEYTAEEIVFPTDYVEK